MVYTMEFTQIESPDSGLVDIYLEALSKDNGVYVDLAEITNELGDTTEIVTGKIPSCIPFRTPSN